MIFITIGTEQYPFNRLLEWVTRAVMRGAIQETVIVQAGACTNSVPGASQFSTLSQERFNEVCQEARLIISHCGEGSFFNLRTLGKPYLLIPRRHGLGEHVDDHQWEMAKALMSMGASIGWVPQDVQRFIQHTPAAGSVSLGESSLVDYLLDQYASSKFQGVVQ